MDLDISAENIDFKYIMKHQKLIKENLKKRDEVVLDDYKMVSFKIGQEYYGIDIMRVKEILKKKNFTIVPNTLDFVLGVLNLRGEIIPIIDIAIMFHHWSRKQTTIKI